MNFGVYSKSYKSLKAEGCFSEKSKFSFPRRAAVSDFHILFFVNKLTLKFYKRLLNRLQK